MSSAPTNMPARSKPQGEAVSAPPAPSGASERATYAAALAVFVVAATRCPGSPRQTPCFGKNNRVNYRVGLFIRVPGRIGSSARQLTCRRARTTFFSTPMVQL